MGKIAGKKEIKKAVKKAPTAMNARKAVAKGGEVATWEKWVSDPLSWVVDIFGNNIREECRKLTGVESQTKTGLTIQQEVALGELGKIIRSKLRAHHGAVLSEKGQEYASKIGISIMSGTGTGKDLFSALVMMYFLSVFQDCKVSATANTAKQLKNVLWSEISKVMALSLKNNPKDEDGETVLGHEFEWQSEKVFKKEKKGKQWFAEAVTIGAKATEQEQGEALGGRHEKYMLLIADEASGIPDGVFKPLEGTLTGVINLLLVIFNPTKSTGFAIDSQKDKRFIALRWDSEESEIVKKSHIDSMAEKYGRDSNTFRIRVKGLPPLSDDNSLIPWDWVEDARTRVLEPLPEDYVVKSSDFGAGGDKSIICTRKGPKLYAFKRNTTKDSTQLTDWVYDDFLDSEADILLGDNIGIGWAVMGNLRSKLPGHDVRSVDFRGRAMREERFFNKRAECYWNIRTVFEKKDIDLSSLSDDQYRELADQIGATKYTEETNKIQIIRKSRIKAEIGHSPDELDSLAIGYAFYGGAMRKSAKEMSNLEKWKEHGRKDSANTEHSWMTA
jgi:phage terminase large subunit